MVKFSLLQTDIEYADVQANIKNVEKLIEEAMMQEEKPDILVLPEDWSSGFSDDMFHNIEKYVEKIDGPSVTFIREMAKKHKVHIVAGSTAIEYEDGNRNTTFFINKEGEIIGDYSKMHLYNDMDEGVAFLNGDKTEVYDTEFGKIGFMNCYDIRFCELSRSYALKGAEILIVVSNFPNPRVNHWRTLLTARAIENQMFVVACNRVGESPMGTYCGNSLIIDPWGNIINDADQEQTIVSGSIDVDEIKKIRSTIGMFRDRQPHSYSKLLTQDKE